MTDSTFNGWANWETWNVSLWVQNEYGLYRIARRFMRTYTGSNAWRDLIADGDLPMVTPDGAAMDDPALDLEELDEMLAELAS